jgi:hypothetical protein
VTSRHDRTEPRLSPEPRGDLAQRAAPLLPPGSRVRQIFIYQTAPNFSFLIITYLTGLTIFWNKYRCVAVTEDAICVLESTKWSGGAKPQRLLATLPRRTQLGPVGGRWAQVNIAGERGWVHKRFHDAINAADRESGSGQDGADPAS